MGDPEFRIEGRPTMKSGPWWQTEDPKNPESKLVNFDKDMFVRAVKDYKAGAQARGDVAMGFEEVDHSDVAYDWLRDPTEIVRVRRWQHVERRVEDRQRRVSIDSNLSVFRVLISFGSCHVL